MHTTSQEGLTCFMSLYIIVGIVLLLCSWYEFSVKRTNKALYYTLFFGLMLMLCLRYGQGTDYFAYQYIYELLPKTLNPITLAASSSLHSEIGWKFLCAFSRILGLHFYVFVAIIGVITMYFLHLFIQKYCPLKITALFIAYPTLFLTYIFSGMRQALVICFFLGVLLDLYLKKKHTLYFILVLLCSLIHTSSLILLVLLLGRINSKQQDQFIVFSWFIGVLFAVLNIRISFLGRVFTNEDSSISYIAVAERLLTYIVIRHIYGNYKRHTNEKNEFLDTIMYIYSICMLLYGIFFSMPTVASRTCYFFKAVEIVVITVLLNNSKKVHSEASFLYTYIALLALVMLYKNIDSYIMQGNYYKAYRSAWSFPYNNIFIEEIYRYSIHQRLLP